jgi:hypothetical protein
LVDSRNGALPESPHPEKAAYIGRSLAESRSVPIPRSTDDRAAVRRKNRRRSGIGRSTANCSLAIMSSSSPLDISGEPRSVLLLGEHRFQDRSPEAPRASFANWRQVGVGARENFRNPIRDSSSSSAPNARYRVRSRSSRPVRLPPGRGVDGLRVREQHLKLLPENVPHRLQYTPADSMATWVKPRSPRESASCNKS